MSYSIAAAPDQILHSVRHSHVSASHPGFDDMDDNVDFNYDVIRHAPQRENITSKPAVGNALQAVLDQVSDFLADGGTMDDLVVAAQDWAVPEEVNAALDETDRLDIGRARAWLLLALWIASQGPESDLDTQARQLQAHEEAIDQSERLVAWEVFDRTLGPRLPLQRSGRAERLRERMGRI